MDGRLLKPCSLNLVDCLSLPHLLLHRTQGYAYVEFVSPEVAAIVAETMNGYYLFDKQLVCRVLRFDEIHPNLFDGAGIKFRKVNWHGLYRQKYNVDR